MYFSVSNKISIYEEKMMCQEMKLEALRDSEINILETGYHITYTFNYPLFTESITIKVSIKHTKTMFH